MVSLTDIRPWDKAMSICMNAFPTACPTAESQQVCMTYLRNNENLVSGDLLSDQLLLTTLYMYIDLLWKLNVVAHVAKIAWLQLDIDNSSWSFLNAFDSDSKTYL